MPNTTHTLTEEQYEKLNKVYLFCCNLMEYFCEYLKTQDVLKNNLTEEELDVLVATIREESYFAGGLFRSYFSNTPIRDIDIFLTNTDASERVSHLLSKCLDNVVVSVSNQNNFIFTDYPIINQMLEEKLGHTNEVNSCFLTIITENACSPNCQIVTFDFSFNRHYVDTYNDAFCFDFFTFLKKGHLMDSDSDRLSDRDIDTKMLSRMLRTLRFLKEGWDINLRNFPCLFRSFMYSTFQGTPNETAGQFHYFQELFSKACGGSTGGPIALQGDIAFENLISGHTMSRSISNVDQHSSFITNENVQDFNPNKKKERETVDTNSNQHSFSDTTNAVLLDSLEIDVSSDLASREFVRVF